MLNNNELDAIIKAVEFGMLDDNLTIQMRANVLQLVEHAKALKDVSGFICFIDEKVGIGKNTAKELAELTEDEHEID
jgi:hypothetical protein